MNNPVNYAGLCLLHPFVERFFTTLGLLDNHKFKSESHAIYATRLLDFLASGMPTAKVPSHSMSRFLCGMEDFPIDCQIPDLEPFAMRESEELLKSVIGQWEILNGISNIEFREKFLTRSGNWIVDNEQTVLHVNKLPIDILLEKLPWSYTIIYLPWMHRAIYVDW